MVTWKDLGDLGNSGDLGVGQKCCQADVRGTHAILPRSSRLRTQPKSSRPHAAGLDFSPRSTHAILRRSRIVWECRGRADFGRGRDFFVPRNVAWVEQNLALARFGPMLGPGQVWPRTDLRVHSKMFFGHNLYYTTPFAIPRAGFCMFVQRASFVCSCPGADF